MNCIKEVLNETGITQTCLVGKLGKSIKIVNAYVCNRQQTTLDILFKIAEILQVSVKDLREHLATMGFNSIYKINNRTMKTENQINQINQWFRQLWKITNRYSK
jgi:transcriptional regulator with XRE-family HTH domain